MTKKTTRLKSIGEPPKTPLLEPARRVHHRVEVVEQDWVDVDRCLKATAGGVYHLAFYHWMKDIDETRTLQLPDIFWSSINEDLEKWRKAYDKRKERYYWQEDSDIELVGVTPHGGIAWLLYHAKSLNEARAPKPNEQDWEEMNRTLEKAREQGWTERGVAWQLHYMKSIDKSRAPEPTEEDWDRMLTQLKNARSRHLGEHIAGVLYHMKFLDATRVQKPTEQDWRDMAKSLEIARKAHTGGSILKLLHHMKSLEEPPEERPHPHLPPLRKF